MTTYKLGSNGLVYTPGIVRWAIEGYRFQKDRKYLSKLISEGWGLPDKAVDALLSGKVPYEVKGDVVVFNYEDRILDNMKTMARVTGSPTGQRGRS